jgi:hypothetical protein
MPTDVLSLAGIVFDDFSTPSDMMGGGNQAMVVHKLPGGSRVIDTLGPDDADITWSGFFFGNDAYATALALDGIRSAGQVVPLIWGGQYRSVIVSHFIYKVRRMPTWVMYDITCTVDTNPMQGGGGAGPTLSVDDMVGSDLGTASAAASDQGTAIGGIGGSGL